MNFLQNNIHDEVNYGQGMEKKYRARYEMIFQARYGVRYAVRPGNTVIWSKIWERHMKQILRITYGAKSESKISQRHMEQVLRTKYGTKHIYGHISMD